MTIINKGRLRQYLDLGYNVLMSGYHGVGKTAIIQQVIEEAGYTMLYSSAPTMDPWVDLVGVPEKVTVDGVSYLEMVKPERLARDEVDIIFLDELNRAPPKVLNAVMELIQFKSVNGKKLNRLKAVWAAINPEDESGTYAVSHLDPAHIDRFHVHLEIPYALDTTYLTDKYGDVARHFINWWNDLPKAIKHKVSPRRVEYAIQAHQNHCVLSDFLPFDSNVSKLQKALKSSSKAADLDKIVEVDDAIKYLSDFNNSTQLLELVKMNDPAASNFFTRFHKLLPGDLVVTFIDYINARKNGVDDVADLGDLIDTINKTYGPLINSQTRVAEDADSKSVCNFINHCDLQLLSPQYEVELESELNKIAISGHSDQIYIMLSIMIKAVTGMSDAADISRAIWADSSPPRTLIGKTPSKFTFLLRNLSKLTSVGAIVTDRLNRRMQQAKVIPNGVDYLLRH